jgi:folate-dependent tRNA-U54 methylase TrmFO/GidA
MKYVMLEVTHGRGKTKVKRLVPFIFPNVLVHADVALAVQRIPGLANAKVVRAGEVHVQCSDTFGESSTLGVKASAADAVTISRYDYFHGLE